MGSDNFSEEKQALGYAIAVLIVLYVLGAIFVVWRLDVENPDTFAFIIMCIFGLPIYTLFFGLFALVVVALVAVYDWREVPLRWFYSLTPHPAEPAIRSALAAGTILDGRQLATILGEAPADNRILRAVRDKQALALIAEMQAVTNRRIRQMDARAKEQYELAAAQQVQAALAQAAVALEQAKAMLQAGIGAVR